MIVSRKPKDTWSCHPCERFSCSSEIFSTFCIILHLASRRVDSLAVYAGIRSSVAEPKQIVEEGYLDEGLRIKAIHEYDQWFERDARCMVMKLNEVRGKI